MVAYKRKKHLFYRVIHFSMQFSAVLDMFVVKTYLSSIFTNENFSKNVQSYRVCSFKAAYSVTMTIFRNFLFSF